MTDPVEQLAQTLRSKGFSLTSSRKIVFDTLQDSEPKTMQQIIKQCPMINQTSVYRTIDLFIRLGIVQKIFTGWKYKLELSDNFREHHHHLICLRCGKISSFDEGENLSIQLQNIASINDFEMNDHTLEIQGYCSSCRAKPA